MDINSLDPKIANAPTTGGRRRDGAEDGFRGVMELMAHLSPQDPAKADEVSRQRASDRSPVERAPEPERGEPREPDEATDKTTDETRQGHRGDRHDARTAAPETSANPTASAPAADRTGSGRAAGRTADAPSVPQSTQAPTPLGTPAGENPASAAPQGTVGTPVNGPANPAPAPTGAAAQAAAAPSAAPQAEAAGTAQATVVQAAAAKPPADQRPTARTGPAQPVPDQPGRPPATASQTAQAPQNQPAQDPTARPGAQPAAGSEPAAASGQALAEARNAGGRGKSLPRDVKVTIEQAPVIARTQGVSSAVLVQAHMAAADGAGRHGAAVAQAAAAQATALQPGTTLHVGGGQALFVGADGGNANAGGAQTADAGQSGSQNPGGQNAGGGGQTGGGQTAGGQAQAGGAFPFGAATIGQRGFGGDAARAQFQEILSTRTARAPLQGGGTTSSASPSSLPFTAGPGGPQSTLTTAMASRAEATAQGRPGALPSTVVGQVAVKLANSAADGGGKLTIRLNPEELGKVDVKLELGKDGTVHARISAERPETLDMLQRDARMLDKALQDAGLKTDQNSLEFDLRGGSGQPTDRGDRQTASAGGPAGPDAPGPTDDAVADPTSPADPGGQRADGSYDLVA
ncbi:hypothetical protein GCM10017083_47460 [Thalassobaculum fulvum]|uniref:Flagellar hook-length control protein-like C-terminal domain-containing protein n=1 Tax=Thalassobaculum fulvum TaxID=1633335 RepID=A0A918XWS7_9PROT|nr:flagellar hook-length control protein FliK [Thalassobaculum fulvum]GHD60884.1 hypothetical protein GCM10017083_47460 [Thalassobaculum fulvum]